MIFLQSPHPVTRYFHSAHKVVFCDVSWDSLRVILLTNPSTTLMDAFNRWGINKIHTLKCIYNITLTAVKIMPCRLKFKLIEQRASFWGGIPSTVFLHSPSQCTYLVSLKSF